MHPYGSPLLAAALRSVGKPARALPPETSETFEIAKKYCRGTECVPLPSTIGAFLNVLKNSDAPERESLFMPIANGPCRFGQYNTLQRIIIDEAGYHNTPMESWDDESGSYGTDMKTSRRLYNAMLTADLLYKARCRIRPYCEDRAEFDSAMNGILSRFEEVLESAGNLEKALSSARNELTKFKLRDEQRPLVGIVGEIYVRLNPFTNLNLIESIEDAGGEAWVAPMSEWFHYLAFLDTLRAKEERHSIGTRLKKELKNAYMMRQERKLTKKLISIIGGRLEPPIESTLKAGERHFPRQFDGESILTVGRAIEFAGQGVDLIINCAPFGCMPGTLTSGIFQKIERNLRVPIVSLFFDGETDLRHLVRTYLANIKTASTSPFPLPFDSAQGRLTKEGNA